MTAKRKLLYYKLTPVFEMSSGSIASAAVQTCHATGEVLSGNGGGGLALSREIVDALDMTKNSGCPMVVCKAEIFDGLVRIAKHIVRDLEDNGVNPEIDMYEHVQDLKKLLVSVQREEWS